MSKVVLTGYMVVPQEICAKVLSALPEHIALTQQEPGCLCFEVTQDVDQPTLFKVYEEFTSQAAFDAHQLRVEHSPWGLLTQGCARHYQVTSTGP